MKPILGISRAAWTALVLSAALAGVTRFASEHYQPELPDETERAALVAEREQLQGNDAELSGLRAEAATREASRAAPASLVQLRAQIGPEWEAHPGEEGAVVLRRTAGLVDWPSIHRAIAELETAFVLQSVELRAAGAGPARRFTHVQLHGRPRGGEPNLFRPDPSGPRAGVTTQTQNPKETP